MELIERGSFIDNLETQFQKTRDGEGHCVFVCGEAGIGKTSLVKTFCNLKKDDCKVYWGTCDALFSPRPLAPLYDIALQMQGDLLDTNSKIEDRAGLFSRFFQALSTQKEEVIMVFEDIHWADEATLDFIKFFSRRITQTRCLFLLTYRDNEILPKHPLRNVLGELVPGTYSRLILPSLSRNAVEKLAQEKGYKGEDVYTISGGNPFYVNEILASYSPGIPDNIKDSVLFVLNRQDDTTKNIWEILSVLPTGLEINYLKAIEPGYELPVENSLALRILVLVNGRLLFKHELYRRTIEQSLSPLKRVALNRQILQLFRAAFEENNQIERIIHHAKNANEYDLVTFYAPLAAGQAKLVGAHIEASKLYLSAIEYYQGNDKDILVAWYELYAYECYLTYQVKEAIIYQGKALTILKAKNDQLNVGNSLRFLSRLWWFEGNRDNAERFGMEAIEALENQPTSSTKAMAFSNMSQLKMLSDDTGPCLFWGGKAIAMAEALHDNEILSHALNNVGTVQLMIAETRERGMELLTGSLSIALENSFHEHAARAYTNLGSNALVFKNFGLARKYLDEGIAYCEERDLDSWSKYMSSCKARLHLETGDWEEAGRISRILLENPQQSTVVSIGALIVMALIRMRTGAEGAMELLLEARKKAVATKELQRIVPVLVAMLEYEWITGDVLIEQASLENTIHLAKQSDHISQKSELAFWLSFVRKQALDLPEIIAGFDLSSLEMREQAVRFWKKEGCNYQAALILYDGDEADKRLALTLLQELGAHAVYEKMKQQMRVDGILKIPRGMRQTTQSNPALLTNREMDILQLLHQGLQNKEIANQLFISAKTVDHHISSILLKLDVNSRGKAVMEALQLGIIK